MINGVFPEPANTNYLLFQTINNNQTNKTYYVQNNNVVYENQPSPIYINNQPYKIIPSYNNQVINPNQNYKYYYNINNNKVTNNVLNNPIYTNYHNNNNIINQPNAYLNNNNNYLTHNTNRPIIHERIEKPKTISIYDNFPNINNNTPPITINSINNNYTILNPNIKANNLNTTISPIVGGGGAAINDLTKTMKNINLNKNNPLSNQPINIPQNNQIRPNPINKQIIQNSPQNNIEQEKQLLSKENQNITNKDENKNNNEEKNENINDNINKEISGILSSKKEEIQKRPLTEKEIDDIYMTGVGLRNLGNTCFINSTLQVLIHCKLFIHNFLFKYPIINEETTPISYQFLLICISVLDAMYKNLPHTDISNFKEVFGKKHPIFNDFSQNDSQEFCRIFLEDLSMELNEAKNKDLYKILTNSEGKSKLFRDKEFEFNFKEREVSFVTKLFYSQIINTFKCQCGAEIYSFQKLLDFPLLLPNDVKEINIYDLLDIHFKNEKITFQDKCQRCKKIGEHIKMMRISRPPQILIISLQRIDEVNKIKNECIVNFPEKLNLYKYIDHEIGFDKEAEYKLFSVVNHKGSVNFGHYFSYIQPINSKNWFLFNDSQVKHVKEGLNSFPNAYALFYISTKNLSN